MTTKRIRKLATVAATAALAVQLFAGTASAAVPNATSGGFSHGDFSGNGWAGFELSYDYLDGSTLSRLYLKIDIAGAAKIQAFDITRGGTSLKGCSVSETVITCSAKTVRNGEHFAATLVVEPLETASEVRLTEGWSASGYVTGGNNSHGDSWDLCQAGQNGCQVDDNPETLNELVSSRTGDDDTAAGYGNLTLSTKTSNNKQSAQLNGLPSGKWASVNDNAGSDGVGFSIIDLSVNGGDEASFELVITYPKNTSAPKSYFHFANANYPDTEYFVCSKKQTTNCFTWNKKTYQATLYLEHNGSLRRTS